MNDGRTDDCVRVQTALSEYLDDELSADLRREIDTHLAGCPLCRSFCDALRQTVELCRKSKQPPVDRDCLRRAADAARQELIRRGLL